MNDDFIDSEGIEDAEMYEEIDDTEEDIFGTIDDIEKSVNEESDMTEKEAFETYELAVALGLGEEIGLEEAEKFVAAKIEARSFPSKGPVSIREAKAMAANTKSRVSTLTGELKCPFEQWIKDVCAGRKTVSDPIGGENSYGKNYDLYAG